MRSLLLRRRAYEKRKRREEVHLIGVRNEIRSALGGELIEDPYSSPKVEQRAHAGEAARIAALREMDLDEGAEMAPADAANELTE